MQITVHRHNTTTHHRVYITCFSITTSLKFTEVKITKSHREVSGQTVQLDLCDACSVCQVSVRLTLVRLPVISATKRRTTEQQPSLSHLMNIYEQNNWR